MDRSSLTAFVVEALGASMQRDAIIMAVCERAQMDWPEAEAFIQEVERLQSQEIARRKRPLLIFLGVLAFLEGMVQAGWSLWTILEPYQVARASRFSLESLLSIGFATSSYGYSLLMGLLVMLVAAGSIVYTLKK